jgi:hypothetical protein
MQTYIQAIVDILVAISSLPGSHKGQKREAVTKLAAWLDKQGDERCFQSVKIQLLGKLVGTSSLQAAVVPCLTFFLCSQSICFGKVCLTLGVRVH